MGLTHTVWCRVARVSCLKVLLLVRSLCNFQVLLFQKVQRRIQLFLTWHKKKDLPFLHVTLFCHEMLEIDFFWPKLRVRIPFWAWFQGVTPPSWFCVCFSLFCSWALCWSWTRKRGIQEFKCMRTCTEQFEMFSVEFHKMKSRVQCFIPHVWRKNNTDSLVHTQEGYRRKGELHRNHAREQFLPLVCCPFR